MITTNQSKTEIKEIVRILYSAKVEELLKNESDEMKNDLNKIRLHFDNLLHESETQGLKAVLDKMQSSEAELKQAIKSLNQVIDSVENTVSTVGIIEKVTRILTRFIPFF
ncbi:MAG: hypothetical protein AAFX46_09575 [Cyanobacteria bacterium J06636_27]